MKKKIWQKNNPKLMKLNTEEVDKLSEEDFVKYVQADVNSQLTWILTRSCKGISCKDCYLKDHCKSKSVADSQALAGAVIKSAIKK